MDELKEISQILSEITSAKEIKNFLFEILTESEAITLSKRWRIIKMLSEGKTQREVSNALGVSLCKVTRGAKILKNNNSIITKTIKEKYNGN